MNNLLQNKARSNVSPQFDKIFNAPSIGNISSPPSKLSLLYPMSLKDLSNGELEWEERDPKYFLENLIKKE